MDNLLPIYEPKVGKSQIIKGQENIIFQITNGKNELDLLNGEYLNNQNLSILDLGQCEIKLKEIYHIKEEDSLIYVKQENINCIASEKNIKYEVFEPYNFTKLNLSICNGDIINLYVKTDLSDETKKIYEELKLMGYNMLDINDPFYQDVCTPYKSSNNTDILLSDRINYIYDNNDAQCQSNCYFSSYLPNSLYLNCTCEIKEDKNNEESKFSGKKIFESFYDILKYSNFKILKCYNLVFIKRVFTKNLGSIITMFIFLIYFICMIIFIIKGIEPLKNKLKEIIKFDENIKNNEIFIFNTLSKKEKSNKEKIIKYKNKNKLVSSPVKKSLILRSNVMNNNKNPNNKKRNYKTKKINFFKLPKSNFDNNPKEKIASPSSKNMMDSNKKDNLNINKNINIENYKEDKMKLDAFELNELEYDEAILKDERTFVKTYLDILCREHKIIFTFIICNDYNLIYIKYARFIFLVATDMALNVFFFSDDSMHKIFLNYGKYNFIQQIPQIVYTTIISQLIEVFLCYLSLTDKHIYKIKNLTKNSEKSVINKIIRCIKLKLINFFVFTFIFFGFYWYIIASFCSVYQNTQITFLKDSLFSFLLGLLYPFVLYLIPTALRILSLRQSKYNLKCIYKLSDIIPFF